MRLLVAIGLIATLVVASAPAGAASYPERTFERTLTVRAGGGGNEINLVLQSAGDWFRYEWSSPTELKFDVHTHVGSEVKTLRSTRATGDKDVFTVESAGLYSLFFESLGDDAIVTLKVRGLFKLQGEPDPQPVSSAIPGVGVALLALGAAGAFAIRNGR